MASKRYPTDLSDAEWSCPKATRTPACPQPARDPRRRLLRAEDRLPVAAVAEGLPALEDGVSLLQEVEDRRHLGADEPGAAATFEAEAGSRARTQRRHRGRAVREDDRGGGEQRGFDGGK